MADFQCYIEKKYSRIYTLQTPTNWAEVSKVLAAIQSDFEGEDFSDDFVTVETFDDLIRFTVRMETEAVGVNGWNLLHGEQK